MQRVYYDRHGKPSQLPVGQEDGKRYRTLRYIDRENTCPACGGHVFYTKNNKCLMCARADACDLYGYLKGIMVFDQCFEGWFTSYEVRDHLGAVGNRIVPETHKATLCEMEDLLYISTPFSIDDAVKKGVDLWLRVDPCSKAGHFGIRTLKNECYFCEQERNLPKPRQTAIGKGETWYTPTEPCKKCGTLSERNVHNGACKGCAPGGGTAPDNRQTTESKMMEENPDLLITRADAITYGMKVYRHGRPCKKGHRGYRYVSTNSCIDCLRGKPSLDPAL